MVLSSATARIGAAVTHQVPIRGAYGHPDRSAAALTAEVVRRYERGAVRAPRKTTLTKLAQALELPLATLAAVAAQRPVVGEAGGE